MDIFDFAQCGRFAQPLRDACAKFGVGNLPYFLAQLSIESRGFTKTRESMAYRAETLLAVCNGRNGITNLSAAQGVVMSGPAAVAEALYGGSWGVNRLGNTQPGDGYKFIGRGLIQTTGRWNYGNVSKHVYGDDRLLTTPELLELADGAAQSAAFFWMSKPELSTSTDVVRITKLVNGGDEGLQDRIRLTNIMLGYTPEQ